MEQDITRARTIIVENEVLADRDWKEDLECYGCFGNHPVKKCPNPYLLQYGKHVRRLWRTLGRSDTASMQFGVKATPHPIDDQAVYALYVVKCFKCGGTGHKQQECLSERNDQIRAAEAKEQWKAETLRRNANRAPRSRSAAPGGRGIPFEQMTQGIKNIGEVLVKGQQRQEQQRLQDTLERDRKSRAMQASRQLTQQVMGATLDLLSRNDDAFNNRDRLSPASCGSIKVEVEQSASEDTHVESDSPSTESQNSPN